MLVDGSQRRFVIQDEQVYPSFLSYGVRINYLVRYDTSLREQE